MLPCIIREVKDSSNSAILEEKKTSNMEAKDMFANLGSIIASLMFVWAKAMFQQYVPYHQLQHNIEKYCQILVRFVYPYIQIRFDELSGDYDSFILTTIFISPDNLPFKAVNQSSKSCLDNLQRE
jgi:hypothetical protein